MASTALSCRQPLEVTLSLGGQDHRFRLSRRQLDLGDAGPIDYYWLDLSELRRIRFGVWPPSNARSCISFWWSYVGSLGLADDRAHRMHLVAALSYPMIAGSKALPGLYRDAILKAETDRDEYRPAPDPDAQARIRAVVQGRDPSAVRHYLDEALGWTPPPFADRRDLHQAVDDWLCGGVDAWMDYGNPGLCAFLDETNDSLRLFRRMGFDKKKRPERNALVAFRRAVADVLAYEVKARFYTCLAFAWAGLIPRLREEHGLSELGERFLRFWHCQGTEVSPTRPAPARIGGAFRGQVLGLHPLSAAVMSDPAALAVAGRYFESAECERVMATGRADDCPLYWDLIGVILTAAHHHRRRLDRQQGDRVTRFGGEAANSVADNAKPSEELRVWLAFEAEDRGLKCGKCDRPWSVGSFAPAGNRVRIRLICGGCSLTDEVVWTLKELSLKRPTAQAA